MATNGVPTGLLVPFYGGQAAGGLPAVGGGLGPVPRLCGARPRRDPLPDGGGMRPTCVALRVWWAYLMLV